MKALTAAALLMFSTSAAHAQVLIEGTVINVDSMRLVGVRVAVSDPEGKPYREVITDSLGEFTIRVAYPMQRGSYTLRSEMLGYHTSETKLDIEQSEIIEVTLVLDVAAIPVEPIRVSARRRYSRGIRDEFYDRAERVRRMGGGTIIDYDELQKNPSARVDNIVVSYSAISITCPPAFYIDGMRATRADVSGLTVSSLEGIEIYRSEFYHLPPRYQSGQACPVVLIWSQVGDRGQGSKLTWKRILIAAGLIGLGVVLLR